MNLRVDEASRTALCRAAARDAQRLLQLVARLVGDRGYRPLAAAREKRSARRASYGSENPRAWNLPSHGRVFPARRVPCRDRRADGAPRQIRWYGTRWRRIRGAHSCDCVQVAAARMGHRSGTAASSYSAQTSRKVPVRYERFGPLDSLEQALCGGCTYRYFRVLQHVCETFTTVPSVVQVRLASPSTLTCCPWLSHWWLLQCPSHKSGPLDLFSLSFDTSPKGVCS